MTAALEGLTEKQSALLRLVASERGIIGVYDERLDAFADDGDPDTINQCDAAGWLRQFYDGDTDNGTLRLTDAGRALIAGGIDA